MKVKYRKTTYEDQELDIDFPIYRKHLSGDHQYKTRWYCKVNEDLIETTITFYDDDKQISIEIDKDIEFSGGKEYEFGLDEYACTKLEFDEAYNEALDILKNANK